MSSTMWLRSTAIGAALLTFCLAWSATAEEAVTSQRLTNPEPENWLLPYRTYNGWRYTPLDEINKQTVAGLKLAFAVPLGMRNDGAGDNQSVPVVNDGFMYVIDPTNTVFKIDVHGGKGNTLWSFDTDTPPERLGVNRGVGLMGDKVLVNTRDGRVIALSRDTGEVIWRSRSAFLARSSTPRQWPSRTW